MGFFDKIFSGLTKTRRNLEELEEIFRDYAPDNEDFYEELEELLVMADVGAATAENVVKGLKKMTWERRFRYGDEARAGLVELLTRLLNVGSTDLKLDTRPSVILMVGVNGVGKTTTIGKLAHQLREQGKKVLLCAGDTFRAAAAEQLGVWAERSGADIVRHEEGSDPAAVVYDSICAAKARGADVVIIDTAGLTGIVLTKLDGTAKGGIVFAIANELKLPVKFVGVGEGMDDLLPFESKNFVEALFK